MRPFAWTFLGALVAATALAQYGPTEEPQPPVEGTRRMEMGPYEVTGRIASVDRARGVVVLSSEGETYTLRYPPSVVRRLSPGDRVTAQLQIQKAFEGTSSKGAGTPAIDPETGSPTARPPGAVR
jgi:hypothetical protein